MRITRRQLRRLITESTHGTHIHRVARRAEALLREESASDDRQTALMNKVYDAVIAEIKADKKKLAMARKLKKDLSPVIQKLVEQAWNNLKSMSATDEEISAAAKKVVSKSNDLNSNSIKNRARSKS